MKNSPITFDHIDGREKAIMSEITNNLEQIVSMLNDLTSNTDYPEKQAIISIVLKDGRKVDIWQSSNDSVFKWSINT